jgi:hypothetical protein
LRRSPLILGAIPAGLVTGAFVWLLVAHGAAAPAKIEALQARADALSAPRADAPSADAGSVAAGAPIFALTTGPGAVQEIEVVLTGIARTPTRTAALISIGGKPAEWLDQGQTKDDVTLTEVGAGKVTVDTPTGSKDVLLGKTASATASGAAAANGDRGPPPGFHNPPPPASAP